MFFSISRQTKENFPNHYQLGKFVVNTDNGWSRATVDEFDIIYKGYVNGAQLDSIIKELIEQTIPTRMGNFCAIVVNRLDNTLKISSDRYRSFPLYYTQGKEVTNLVALDTTVYSDNIISVDAEFNVEYPLKKNFDIIGEVNTNTMSFDQVLEQVDQKLLESTKLFVDNVQHPIKVYFSGGVDSLLVFSYLKKFTDNYEIIKCDHVEYDKFWLLNSNEIKKYWGYNQIHHWREPCILTSGTPGDEFMFRNPAIADLFLKYHGIKINQLMETAEWGNCLHYEFFHSDKYQKILNNQLPPAVDQQTLIKELCNTVLNDWQHWHLGNTLTWTPLRDIEIFKLILRLPLDECVGQVLNSKFSIALIEQNSPGLSCLLSKQKNSGKTEKCLIDFLNL